MFYVVGCSVVVGFESVFARQKLFSFWVHSLVLPKSATPKIVSFGHEYVVFLLKKNVCWVFHHRLQMFVRALLMQLQKKGK